MHAWLHAWMYVWMHAWMHARMHARMHAWIHKQAYQKMGWGAHFRTTKRCEEAANTSRPHIIRQSPIVQAVFEEKAYQTTSVNYLITWRVPRFRRSHPLPYICGGSRSCRILRRTKSRANLLWDKPGDQASVSRRVHLRVPLRVHPGEIGTLNRKFLKVSKC